MTALEKELLITLKETDVVVDTLLAALTKAYAHFLLHTEHDCWDDDDNDVMLLMFDAITKAKKA